jgi:hypothetical protein
LPLRARRVSSNLDFDVAVILPLVVDQGFISKASHASSTPEVGVAVPSVTAVPDVAVTLLFSITAAVSAMLVYEP